MSSNFRKAKELLGFLKAVTTLRRERVPAYRSEDRILWFAEVPKDLPHEWKGACKSAFLADNPDDVPDLWLEVRKKPMPPPPSLPSGLRDWVPQKFQEHPRDYLDHTIDQLLGLLNPQITVLVEKLAPDPDTSTELARTLPERFPEVRYLKDFSEVQDAWLEYLIDHWEPWVRQMRQWKQIQDVYEVVDFMRRRLEEAEERYELVLAIGLLQWRDSTGVTVKRHLLTAPAEITLDAARGVLTVRPAASFERFRVELDMLTLQDQPRLEEADLGDRLEALDVRAWAQASVVEILHTIANQAKADAQVMEDWKPFERVDDTFRILYAPALVLRERHPTAYEELINRLLKVADDELAFSTTDPWEQFISEGETPWKMDSGATQANGICNLANSRLYFPLPTNDEQRKIIEYLQSRPYVLVKGPPGTGKSHTIANLICHLLAMGERVLVTAHTGKALAVLRGLLPKSLRDLCVTAFGSSREDHRLLESSVQRILSQKDSWKGPEWAQSEVEQLEAELLRLESGIARVDRELRECREAETHTHALPGGYGGTAAQIARQVERERMTYDWFPKLPDDQTRCPLDPEEILFLADFHRQLTPARLQELMLDVGTFSLPDPETFAEGVERLNDAEKAALGPRIPLGRFSAKSLEACKDFLIQLEERVTRGRRRLGNLIDEILKDLLVGQTDRWERLERETADLIRQIQRAREGVGTAKIDTPPDIEDPELLYDARRRLEHFQKGGRRGWWFFTPRVVRETHYIEKRCRVQGKPPRDRRSLEMLVRFLELRDLLKQFHAVWPIASDPKPAGLRLMADGAWELFESLHQLLEFFRIHRPKDLLAVIPIGKRETLVEHSERERWCRSIDVEIAQSPFKEWRRAIQSLDQKKAHPCIDDLRMAIEERDPDRWKAAWEKREELRRDREHLHRYEELLDKIQAVHFELATSIRSTQGNPDWTDRLRKLREAWDWASARAWLRRVTDPDHYERLTHKHRQLQDTIEKTTERLAAQKAWQVFFSRLDDRTHQNLVAWRKAVARIGKGTGKYAYKHRIDARKYLMACLPKIPAWIMPLHKLWETVDPKPGIFDTVIIDEASQAGIEALVLLLLGKRIIVVGDDKQNSPEAVGVLEDDIARLARDYLKSFTFRNEFRPDTSLYDHAERAFGHIISLREHFRCVPEIIRFSNELCYADAPLIPLRQPPPRRLSPLKAVFVGGGFCEGEGQQIRNLPEVEAVVKTIQECLNDEAYQKKTMGVIVLQGHAQARLIEQRLAEMLEPETIADRKLRCGVPATFQGDERDVIFLSLVVAPNHPYRALTGLADQRRFNVAMSRARDQVWLFHSVQLHDLSREDLRWRLLNFFNNPSSDDTLYEELDRLEREAKRSSRQLGEQPEPYESWFEVDVALELLRRKYRLRSQVDVAGYRIDLVVEGLNSRLAVECDGEAWHGPDKFEQDMARQRQLERAGWTFVRIRESEFYADRERAIRRIIETCEKFRIRPVGEEDPKVDKELPLSSFPPKSWSRRHDPEEDQDKTENGEEETDENVGYPGFPDPRNTPIDDVCTTLRQIIEQEGPLTKRWLIRLYVEGCPELRRAGKTVKGLLNRALYSMQKAGEIVVEDELGDRSLESQVIRRAGTPGVRERPAGRRGLLEIPPSELMSVLDQVQASIGEAKGDDEALARLLLNHYGFRRLTAKRRAYVQKIISHWRRQRGAKRP